MKAPGGASASFPRVIHLALDKCLRMGYRIMRRLHGRCTMVLVQPIAMADEVARASECLRRCEAGGTAGGVSNSGRGGVDHRPVAS